MISWLTGFLADAQWSKEKQVRPILIYLTALATRGKHPNWLLGGVFPTTYILGGETIIIRLPEVEITGIEIDNDSFEKLDESNNIFNPITVEDLNKAQKNLKEEMYQRALEKGILDMAKSNAEEVLKGMLSGANGDYDIKFEWQ